MRIPLWVGLVWLERAVEDDQKHAYSRMEREFRIHSGGRGSGSFSDGTLFILVSNYVLLVPHTKRAFC